MCVDVFLFVCVCECDLYLMSHRADCPADVVIDVTLKFQEWLNASRKLVITGEMSLGDDDFWKRQKEER